MAPLPPRVGITEQTVAPRRRRDVERSAGPFERLLGGRNGGFSRMKTRSAIASSRQEVGGATEAGQRHALVQPREDVGVRRLEAHRHFERARRADRGRPGIARMRAGQEGGVRLDDDPLEPRHGPRDRPSSSAAGMARGSKKLPALYSLICRAGGQRLERAPDLQRQSRPGGTSSSSVFTHRSHITQRKGHSRLVRKTTAVGRDAAAPVALFLPEAA